MRGPSTSRVSFTRRLLLVQGKLPIRSLCEEKKSSNEISLFFSSLRTHNRPRNAFQINSCCWCVSLLPFHHQTGPSIHNPHHHKRCRAAFKSRHQYSRDSLSAPLHAVNLNVSSIFISGCRCLFEFLVLCRVNGGGRSRRL